MDCGNENISKDLREFGIFAREVFSQSNKKLKSIFLETSYPLVNQSENCWLNVSVLNLLNERIDELNLTFNSQRQSFELVYDEEMVNTSFSFITSQNKNYTLTLTYSTFFSTYEKNFTIEVEIGKSKFTGFFILALETPRVGFTEDLSKECYLE